MRYSLRLNKAIYEKIRHHLFPGDGKESVGLVLCGRMRRSDHYCLLAHEFHPIPEDECFSRSKCEVHWNTSRLPGILQRAEEDELALLKIHSHPTGMESFSQLDDKSDRDLFRSVPSWLNNESPNASALMLPDGAVIARMVTNSCEFIPVDRVMVVGEEICTFDDDTISAKRHNHNNDSPEFTRRHAQMFGSATTMLLQRMKIGIVGVSGTGSIVAELLTRLGVGELVLSDPDRIEAINLNRIINSRASDIGRYKTERMDEAIREAGLGTKIKAFSKNLFDRDVIHEISTCDVVFGCVDTSEGRHLLNTIATFYIIPYFDVGIRLDADGAGGIKGIWGSVHYLKPGESSLISRKAITMEEIESEGLRRTNPEEYDKLLREKYIIGVMEERPAVISLNMYFASMAVNEFLARIHPYRLDGNSGHDWITVSLSDFCYCRIPPAPVCNLLKSCVGRGDITPMLNMPALETS